MNSITSDYSSVPFDDAVSSVLHKVAGNNTETENQRNDQFVSDSAAFWIEIIVQVILSGVVGVIGMVANIVNIVVFVRQGVFTESGSVSLLGLAVSDLCCVTSMVWFSISFGLVFVEPSGLWWNPHDVMYLTGGWPHLMFAQITRTVTAYVALERCICVVFPFKVKSLFTPRRSMAIITSIFVIFGMSYSPVFITRQLKFRSDPNTNTTRLVMVSSTHWQLAVDIMYYINSITFNIGSVAVVLISTMITVSRVNLSKMWRQSMATGNSLKQEKTQSLKTTLSGDENTQNQNPQPSKMSDSKMQKEKKLVRMITLISVIFLICYIPDLTYLIMLSVNSEIRITKRYENLANVMYAFTFFMETVNSSINITVYVTMSSRYKKELRELCCRKIAIK